VQRAIRRTLGSSYRWVVLAVFMLAHGDHAPINNLASRLRSLLLAIGVLAMSFMIAFIPSSRRRLAVVDTVSA
jgi:hypothetical protein